LGKDPRRKCRQINATHVTGLPQLILSTPRKLPLPGSTLARGGASSLERAIAKLKSAGLRITQPGIAILTALHPCEQLTSIEQLHFRADNLLAAKKRS